MMVGVGFNVGNIVVVVVCSGCMELYVFVKVV